MFLVLSYTPISIFSLGWLSLSGSWLLPALQVPSVTRTTPTYWARLHSPVNYQTGVSFCSSSANPLLSSFELLSCCLSRDLALFLHRHHMNRISCGNLNRLLSTLRWLPWTLITIRHLLLRSIGTMYGPTSCDLRYSPLSSFSLWGGYFLPGPQVLSFRVNIWRRSLITFRRLPLFLNSLPALQAQPYMCSHILGSLSSFEPPSCFSV